MFSQFQDFQRLIISFKVNRFQTVPEANLQNIQGKRNKTKNNRLTKVNLHRLRQKTLEKNQKYTANILLVAQKRTAQ